MEAENDNSNDLILILLILGIRYVLYDLNGITCTLCFTWATKHKERKNVIKDYHTASNIPALAEYQPLHNSAFH